MLTTISLDSGGPRTKSALTDGTISVGLLFSSDAFGASELYLLATGFRGSAGG